MFAPNARRARRAIAIEDADDRSSHEFNQKLSLKRAENVRDELVKNGVSPDMLKVEAKGETEPLLANRSEASRATNRRVDILIPGKAAAPAVSVR